MRSQAYRDSRNLRHQAASSSYTPNKVNQGQYLQSKSILQPMNQTNLGGWKSHPQTHGMWLAAARCHMRMSSNVCAMDVQQFSEIATQARLWASIAPPFAITVDLFSTYVTRTVPQYGPPGSSSGRCGKTLNPNGGSWCTCTVMESSVNGCLHWCKCFFWKTIPTWTSMPQLSAPKVPFSSAWPS